ncbi:MAG: hypothetical protein ACRD4M_12580 [Candidatus Acidiferrales bacterium]
MTADFRTYPPRGSGVIQAMLKRLAAEEEQLKLEETKQSVEATKPQLAKAARL